MHNKVWDNLNKLRKAQPLIHNITNQVVMNNTANALLAIGASPIMAHAKEEVADMVAIVGSLVINTGTIASDRFESMLLAVKAANQQGKHWILDPVGAGATPYRLECNRQLLEYKPSVVRGNASEISALFTDTSGGKGVDSTDSSESTLDFLQRKASEHNLVIAVTGATDYITDGETLVKLENGHPMMAKVTGTGCTATALIGAFLAVCDTPLEAAISGLACLGLSGERASTHCPGPGSLQLRLLDELYQIDKTTLSNELKLTI
ncbi:hydroxyethylthiazole kinase [Endozoicomonas sp. (ex Bugula neritina AB1)]|nr:hydroxyethylthiazole kinase [Endozoicomonas sp. (ex Bugula neritina AB1)]